MRRLDRRLVFLHRGVLQLLLPDAARQQPLGSQQHHRDQDDPVDEEVEPADLFGKARPVADPGIERAQADAVREGRHVLRQAWDQVENDVVENQRADDDAADVAHASEHHHDQDGDRDDEQEVVRADKADVGGVVRARKAAERGPDPEGKKLGGHCVDSHGRRSDLVLADRHPGSSEAGVVEVGDQDDGDGDEETDEHVVGDGVGVEVEGRHDLELWVAGPGPLDPGRQQRLVDQADGVDAARPLVEVVEELRHDLAESEGHDRQVVAAQAERRESKDRSESRGDEHGDEDQDPEADVHGMMRRR